LIFDRNSNAPAEIPGRILSYQSKPREELIGKVAAALWRYRNKNPTESLK
jgi:hypothetical protein